jgi:predicted nucleic acid-binding protein
LAKTYDEYLRGKSKTKGITIPTTDLIIACLAMENSCLILTLDPHFLKIPETNLFKICSNKNKATQ